MQNPESQKPNRTLLYVVGGCAVVFFLCAICAVGVFFFGRDPLNQIVAQLGVPSPVASVSASPTVAAVTSSSRTPTTSAPRSTPTTAAQPSTGGNPLDALTKSFTNWGSVKSFRARMSTTGTPEMTLEMVSPDRIHMSGSQFEMILIGNTSYVKIGNTWQKMNLPQSVDVNLFNPKSYQTQIQGLPDIKLIGPDTVDGVPTMAYQFGTTLKGQSQSTTTKIWIGIADGFPHKIETGGTTITFYDFNANIAINPPIP